MTDTGSDGPTRFAEALQTRFGITIPSEAHPLLALAFTHPSRHRDSNNQRLEFLGDRVLGLVLAQTLYTLYPDEAEGPLALRHAALVRAQSLSEIARRLDLGSYLDLGRSERASGMADLENVLADTLEAILGAFYLCAGLDLCQAFIDALWKDAIDEMIIPPQDPKTALQEWTQARSLPLPVYEMINRTGPDHAPHFTLRVTIEGAGSATAQGSSRRIAEKQAADDLLHILERKSIT